MGRLSAETEERMINIENNYNGGHARGRVREEGGERRRKCTSSQDHLGPVRPACCLQVLTFPTETKPPKIKDCSCVPSSLYPREAGVNTHWLGKEEPARKPDLKLAKSKQINQRLALSL